GPGAGPVRPKAGLVGFDAVHRLRDLDRRQRLLAGWLVLLLLLPFAASLVRAWHHQWLPTADDALIGLRSLDVFSRHLPLVGQPSTSHLYGNQVSTSHPGPIEFYWLALPVRLLGASAGMLLGSGLANLAGVLVAAWVVFRRAGPAVGAWSVVLLGGVLWSEGTAVLTDPISSNAGGIPLLALAALAWAVAGGDRRLLPLTALFGSWVAQQHLSIVVPAASVVALAIVGTAPGALRAWPGRRSAPAEASRHRDGRTWPWVLGALGVITVGWAPVVWQQLTGHPGNITAILDYAGSSGSTKLGGASGVRQAVRALGSPPLLTRWDLKGTDFFQGPLHGSEVIVASLGALILVLTVVLAWSRRRPLALLALTALVLALGGVYNGSSIPVSIEAFRISFYRWTFVVAWLAWTVYGWLAGLAVEAVRSRSDDRDPRLISKVVAPVLAVIALVPAAAGAVAAGADDERRAQGGYGVLHVVADAAVAEAAGTHRVTLVLSGGSAVLASGPAVTMALAAHGHEVVLPGVDRRFYGRHRVLRRGGDPGDLILQLVTGRGYVPPGPGRVILHRDLNPDLNAVLRPFVVRALATAPVRSAGADRLLANHWPTATARRAAAATLARIQANPALVMSDPENLDVLAAGYFTAPALDPARLARARRLLPARELDYQDVFELRVLTRAELRQVAPSRAAP
ncbi:MAG: hypothetical protein ACR2MB_04120, partial [Acidimicrobiales bacterium]